MSKKIDPNTKLLEKIVKNQESMEMSSTIRNWLLLWLIIVIIFKSIQ